MHNNMNWIDNFVGFFKFVFTNSYSSSLISAVLGSLITLFVTTWIGAKQREKESRQKYLNLVTSTLNELEFYVRKLEQLSAETKTILNALSSATPPLIPTYSLYPSFLEQAKLNLSNFNINPELVKRVGHCHFELSHIQQRLELMKSELRTKDNSPVLIANVGGFKALVDSNISEFNLVISELKKELKQLKKA